MQPARRPLGHFGWVPFKGVGVKLQGTAIRYYGKSIRVFDAKRLQGLKLRTGCFAQDSVGDWWFCVAVDAVASECAATQEAVGIDLGLKDAAVTSDGERLTSSFYRGIEPKISVAQRRGHKRQAKRLHRKVTRQRQDALHKFSRRIVNTYQTIVIGDVSSTKMVKTRMAKSALDSGWGMLKNYLGYKGQLANRDVQIVDEAYTTRACSQCGSMSGPQGLRGLAVREWACRDCGASHDRDINAARNILRLRYQPPSAGTSRDIPAWVSKRNEWKLL